MKINEDSYIEIERLSNIALSKLLFSLLNNEARKYKFKGINDKVSKLDI